MKVLNKKLAAVTVAAALGASGLGFAAETQGSRHFHRGGALMQILTDSQKAQAKTVFEQARQTSQPVRQQLRENRKLLRAAVQSGDTAKIQQVSATEGSEIGQLMAIRSSAFSKVYQNLTPDQKQKLAEMQQARHNRSHERGGRSAS